MMSAEMDKNSALVASHILSTRVKSYFSKQVLMETCHKKINCHKKMICKYYIASMCSDRLVYAK